MTVVYLDSVLALNTLMDYLLLLATARASGTALRRGRLLTAAILGGVYAASVFLPGLAGLAGWPGKLAAGVLMVLIAFGREEKLLRLTLLFFILSCALAGGVLAFGMLCGAWIPVVNGVFYTDVSPGSLLAAATAAYVLTGVVFRFSASHAVKGELLTVCVALGRGRAELTALRDSGNTLRDMQTGTPLLVVSWKAVRHLLPGVPPPEPMKLNTLAETFPELCPALIPYSAVGVSGGLLVTVKTRWVEMEGHRMEGARIALTAETLGEGYAALWGGEGKEEGHECVGEGRRMARGAWIFETGHDPLYRRQRHTAAAAGKGAGGGASGADGGGRSTERAYRA